MKVYSAFVPLVSNSFKYATCTVLSHSYDKGWKFAFLGIFIATVLFGFVALSLEGAHRAPGGGDALCAAFEAELAAGTNAMGQVMAQAGTSSWWGGGASKHTIPAFLKAPSGVVLSKVQS